MLQWDHKYELGHARIDAEHKIFLGLIIEFQEISVQGASREKLTRVLNEIVKYAEFHFLSEENIMEDFNYPDKAQHTAHHQSLLAEIKNKLYEFKRNSVNAEEVFDFLFQWFALHTSVEDKKLVGYVDRPNNHHDHTVVA